MTKDKIAYVCSNCGQESPKWIGKCPSCRQWNTFKEIRVAAESGTLAARSAALTINAHKNAMNGGTTPVFLRDISAQD